MNLSQIYKCYKHAGNMKIVSKLVGIEKIYKALKKHHLQVFLVKGMNGKQIWNFVPEENLFFRIV